MDKLKPASNTANNIALMQNLTDTDSRKAEELVNETLQKLENTSCEEPKCNGNGNCVNGTCVCSRGKLLPNLGSEVSSLDLDRAISFHNIVLVLTRQDLNSNPSVRKIRHFHT